MTPRNQVILMRMGPHSGVMVGWQGSRVLEESRSGLWPSGRGEGLASDRVQWASKLSWVCSVLFRGEGDISKPEVG